MDIYIYIYIYTVIIDVRSLFTGDETTRNAYSLSRIKIKTGIFRRVITIQHKLENIKIEDV